MIAEEMDVHKCRFATDCKIVRNVLWIFDGTCWYPLRITNQNATSEKNIP
jgi:hypothetical protein